jgi:hypothetical protein
MEYKNVDLTYEQVKQAQTLIRRAQTEPGMVGSDIWLLENYYAARLRSLWRAYEAASEEEKRKTFTR